MTVELKKTKITKSIITQSLRGSYNLFYGDINHEILGWCIIKNKKEVLLYNKLTNQIITFHHANQSDITLIEENTQLDDKKGGYIYPNLKKIKVYFKYLNNSLTITQDYEKETFEDMELKFKKIKQFYSEVNLKGQIYL